MFPKKLLLLITVFLSALSYALAQDVTGQVFYNANSGDTTVVELGRYTTDSATGITTFNLYDRDSLQGSGGYSLDLNGNTRWNVIVRAYLSGNSSQASQYDTTYYGDAKSRMGAIQFVANTNRLTDSVNINLLKTSQNSSATMPLTVNGSMLLSGLSLPGSYSVTLDFKLKTDAGHTFGNTIRKSVNVSANGYYSDTVHIPALTGKIKPKITFRNCAQQLHTSAGKWNHSINDFSSSPQSITLDTLDYCPNKIIKVQAQSPFFNPASDDLLYILYKQMSNGSWSAVDSIFGDTAYFPVTGNLLNHSFTASAEMTTASANWGKTMKTFYRSTINSSLADTIHPPSGAIRNATINLKANSSGVPTKNVQVSASLTGAPDSALVDVYLQYTRRQWNMGRDTVQGRVIDSVLKVNSIIPRLRYTINAEFEYKDCNGQTQKYLKSKVVSKSDSTVHYGVLPWCKNPGSKKIEGDVYHPSSFSSNDSIKLTLYELTYDAFLNKKLYNKVNLSMNSGSIPASSNPTHYLLNLPTSSNANNYVLKADYSGSSALSTYYGDDTRKAFATVISFNQNHLTGYDINLQASASTGPKWQYIKGDIFYNSSIGDTTVVEVGEYIVDSATGSSTFNLYDEDSILGQHSYTLVLNGGNWSNLTVRAYLASNSPQASQYDTTYYGDTNHRLGAITFGSNPSGRIDSVNINLLKSNQASSGFMPLVVTGSVNPNGFPLPSNYFVNLRLKFMTDAGHGIWPGKNATISVNSSGTYNDTIMIPANAGRVKPIVSYRDCAQNNVNESKSWNASINNFSSSHQSLSISSVNYCSNKIIKVQANSTFFNPNTDDLLYVLYKQASSGSWLAIDSITGDTANFSISGSQLNNSFTASAEMTTGSANWGKTVKTFYRSTTNSSFADTIYPPSGAIRNATINLKANSSGVPTKNTQITASLTGAPDGTNVDVYLHYIGQGKSGRDTLQGTITNSVLKVFSSIPKLRYTVNAEFAYHDCKGNKQKILKSKFVANMDSTVHYGVLPWCKNLGSKKIEGDVYHPTTFLPGDSIYMTMYEVTYDAFLNKKQYKRVNLSWNNRKFVANSSPAHYTLNLPSGSNANTYVLKADYYGSSAFGTYYGDDTRRTHATTIHFNGSHLTGYDINLQSGSSSGPRPQYISGYAGLENSSVQDSIHVLLIKQSINSQGDTLLNVAQSRYLTNSSYYQFVLNGGIASTYYVKGYLDSNATNYGSYLPTYVGQTPFWNAADTINTTGSSQIILGQLDLLAGNFSGGPGFVSGKVNAGAGKRSSGEAGVDMILTDMNDDPVAFNTTDAQGTFRIANLPYGDYKLRAEVPGKQSDVHSFTLNSGDPSETSVIFRSDSTRIVLVSVSLDEHPLLRGLQAYPNPAKDKLHLQWDDAVPMTWKLQNISGEVIRRGAIDSESRSILDLSAINSGMYLLQIRSEGETAARKIIVR